MKIIIFDVGNAACSVISSPTNIGLMIDCGSNSNKENPIEVFNQYKEWLGVTPFINSYGKNYELGLLHITHPDDDHVRNAKRIENELTPYLLQKRKSEEFFDSDSINADYVNYIDKKYRGNNPENINWGFDRNETFKIPMDFLRKNEALSRKLRNNSSIMRFIESDGVKILYSGDMEKEGWEWLINNDNKFVETISNGVDILISSHHGHKSGFSSSFFEKAGNVKCVIHSKGTEGEKENTDVSSQYSNKAVGAIYKSLNDNSYYKGKVLSTRSNGNIFINIKSSDFKIYTTKASSNHQRL